MKIKGQNAVLDELDWKVLRLLQENARQTYTEIGKKLNMAHSTIRERVKRMEKHGIIKRYQAVVDLEKAGIQQITAIMTIYTEPKESERTAEKLSQFEEVLEVYTSFSEELTINAKVESKNQSELQSFIAKSVAPLSGVSRIKTSIITKKFKEETRQPPYTEKVSS